MGPARPVDLGPGISVPPAGPVVPAIVLRTAAVTDRAAGIPNAVGMPSGAVTDLDRRRRTAVVRLPAGSVISAPSVISAEVVISAAAAIRAATNELVASSAVGVGSAVELTSVDPADDRRQIGDRVIVASARQPAALPIGHVATGLRVAAMTGAPVSSNGPGRPLTVMRIGPAAPARIVTTAIGLPPIGRVATTVPADGATAGNPRSVPSVTVTKLVAALSRVVVSGAIGRRPIVNARRVPTPRAGAIAHRTSRERIAAARQTGLSVGIARTTALSAVTVPVAAARGVTGNLRRGRPPPARPHRGRRSAAT